MVTIPVGLLHVAGGGRFEKSPLPSPLSAVVEQQQCAIFVREWDDLISSIMRDTKKSDRASLSFFSV